MNSQAIRRKLAFTAVGLAGWVAAGAAQAGGVNWSIGINLPPVGVVTAPAPVYYPPPPVVYYPPPPVVYYPPVPVAVVPVPIAPIAPVVGIGIWGSSHDHHDHDGHGHWNGNNWNGHNWNGGSWKNSNWNGNNWNGGNRNGVVQVSRSGFFPAGPAVAAASLPLAYVAAEPVFSPPAPARCVPLFAAMAISRAAADAAAAMASLRDFVETGYAVPAWQ